MTVPPQPRPFLEDDREEIVRTLKKAGVPDPSAMAHASEQFLSLAFMFIDQNKGSRSANQPQPDFIRALRQLLKARAWLKVIAAHLEMDWRASRSLNHALDRRGNGSARDQVAGALALIDKLEQLRLPSKSRGRPHDDDILEFYVLHYLHFEFKKRGLALKIGSAASPGIGVVGALLHALTGRRPTNDALYKRIRLLTKSGPAVIRRFTRKK